MPAAPALAAPAVPEPPKPPEIRRWHRKVGGGVVKLALAGIEKGIDKLGRVADAPDRDDDDVVEATEDFAEQMAIWFPNTDVPPWGRGLIVLAGIAGEMYVDAEPKKKELPSNSPGAKSSQQTATPQPTAPAAPTPSAPAEPTLGTMTPAVPDQVQATPTTEPVAV